MILENPRSFINKQKNLNLHLKQREEAGFLDPSEPLLFPYYFSIPQSFLPLSHFPSSLRSGCHQWFNVKCQQHLEAVTVDMWRYYSKKCKLKLFYYIKSYRSQKRRKINNSKNKNTLSNVTINWFLKTIKIENYSGFGIANSFTLIYHKGYLLIFGFLKHKEEMSAVWTVKMESNPCLLYVYKFHRKDSLRWCVQGVLCMYIQNWASQFFNREPTILRFYKIWDS